MSRRVIFGIFIVALSFGTASRVFAQDDGKAEAIELIRSANVDFDAKNFHQAIIKYRRAYQISEDARILFRLGVAYENENNFQRAREHLERFVLADPESPYVGRAKAKIEKLRALEPEQAFVEFETLPSGARVFINGDSVSEGVTPVQVPLGTGGIDLILESDGSEPFVDRFELAAGDRVKRIYDLSQRKLVSSVIESAEVGEEISESTQVALPMTYVSVAPPPTVNVIGWVAMSVGYVGVVAGVVAKNVPALGGGAALFAVGGYLILVRDWTSDLPDAVPALSMEPATTSGMEWQF